MYSLKNNGDMIAKEFAGLMGAATVAAPAPAENVKTASEACGGIDGLDGADDGLDADLRDLILDEDPEKEEGSVSDLIDDNISDMSSYAGSENASLMARASYIVSGLNKISEDLRRKGEVFAADVVEATALGITSDLKKEANNNKEIIVALEKIAKELVDSGDQFAADMVTSTVNKIS
jgi:hypothetical protein